MNRQHSFRWIGATVVLGSLLGSPATAQLWGVQGNSTIGDIRTGGGQTNFTFDAAGGAGVPIAEVSIDDAVTQDAFGNGPWDRGTTDGFAGLKFAANSPPALKAEAILTGNLSRDFRFGSFPAGAVVSTGMFASDLFQYTGSTPTTLALTFSLEGVLSDPVGNTTANSLTNLRSNVAVFADTPDYGFYQDIGTLVFELGATLKQSGGVDASNTTTLRIEDDTAGLVAMRQTTLLFDVVPGETFYVHQTLTAQAAFGTRLADAFSTLTANFDQPQFVTSLSIPEPASIALLGIVVVGFATWRTAPHRLRSIKLPSLQ